MLNSEILQWLVPGLISAAMAAAAVYWLAPQRHKGRARGTLADGLGGQEQVFLFDGTDLIDASSAARDFLKTDIDGFDWASLRDTLTKRFPGFPKSPGDVREVGKLRVAASGKNDETNAICEWIDGITRVRLHHQNSAASQPALVTKELETLRMAMGQAPYPVWHVGPDGMLNWSNAAYDALLKKAGNDQSELSKPILPSRRSSRKTRACVAIAESDQKLWFDVFVFEQESGVLCYGVDINAIVDAEIAQRNFVQTLAKTFAQLSIGLAIFDRNRQLALFNPALIDLTALPADFLSARPNLLSFFDRLRDQRMMPEPKNYGSWRHQMADLVAAAADGRYQETWTLPSGAVYSVCGRPHPDGAVAFLIEDITAEITLTRRFRTDLEIGQSVMDQMADAIAVFSENGALCFSNQAYRRLWRVDPEASFVQMAVLDATRTWQSLCQPTPVLGEVRDFVGLRENRAEWWGQIQLKTGQDLTCGVFPVSHGATMVVFSRVGPGHAPVDSTQPGSIIEPAPDG
jgi:PAS domain-containing protein